MLGTNLLNTLVDEYQARGEFAESAGDLREYDFCAGVVRGLRMAETYGRDKSRCEECWRGFDRLDEQVDRLRWLEHHDCTH
jgi:hypothetical protein